MLSSSRLRRSSAALVPALLLASLAACGTSTGYGDSTVSGLDSFTVAGPAGGTPTITWNAEPSFPTSVSTKTLVQGTGAKISGNDPVEVLIHVADPLVDLYKARTDCHGSAAASPSAAGSGSAGAKKSASAKSTSAHATPTASLKQSVPASPSASVPPTPVTLTPCPDAVSYPLKGSWVYQSAKPESLTPAQVSPVFQKALDGAAVGSRIEVLAGSPDVFPAQSGGVAGSPQLGVGTQDPVVMVLDVVKKAPAPLTGPKGAPQAAPSWAPKLKLDAKHDPIGLDFTGIAKPDPKGKLRTAILIKGTGARVKPTDTLTVNYYGTVYGSKKPFDESYTKTPYTAALSSLVKGWQQGLTGVPVGSRVLLQIPPALGYGSSAQSGIPANSTLYFVLDILAAN